MTIKHFIPCGEPQLHTADADCCCSPESISSLHLHRVNDVDVAYEHNHFCPETVIDGKVTYTVFLDGESTLVT